MAHIVAAMSAHAAVEDLQLQGARALCDIAKEANTVSPTAKDAATPVAIQALLRACKFDTVAGNSRVADGRRLFGLL